MSPPPNEFDELGKLIPKAVIEKVYDDAVSDPAKEVGKLGVDVVKTARLLLALHAGSMSST